MFNTDFIAQRSKFYTRIVKAARISVQAPQFSLSISDDSLSPKSLAKPPTGYTGFYHEILTCCNQLTSQARGSNSEYFASVP